MQLYFRKFEISDRVRTPSAAASSGTSADDDVDMGDDDEAEVPARKTPAAAAASSSAAPKGYAAAKKTLVAARAVETIWDFPFTSFNPAGSDHRQLPTTLAAVDKMVADVIKAQQGVAPRSKSAAANEKMKGSKRGRSDDAGSGAKKSKGQLGSVQAPPTASMAGVPFADLSTQAASAAPAASSSSASSPGTPDLVAQMSYAQWPAADAKRVAQGVLDKIDALLRINVYTVRDDAGQAVILKDAKSSSNLLMKAKSPILRLMTHVSISDMEYIASNAKNTMGDGSQAYLTMGLWKAAKTGFNPEDCRYPRYDESRQILYVPLIIPTILTDDEWSNKRFFEVGKGTPAGASWTGEQMPRGYSSIYCYKYDDALLSGRAKFFFAGSSGAHDIGRSDSGDAAFYWWTAVDPQVGLAVGLDPARRKPPPDIKKLTAAQKALLPPQPVITEYLTGHRDLRYWKEWKDSAGGDQTLKANQPQRTIPQPPFGFAKLPLGAASAGGAAAASSSSSSAAPASRAGMAGKLQTLALLRQKRKGDWASGRIGVPLTNGKIEDRGGAATAMSDMLESVGYGDYTSATELVKYAVAYDKDAIAAWAALSDGLRKRNNMSEADLTAQLSVLRTVQNWCHLIGQGDGGVEAYDNLVAGSEHANTEQLAIETAQRDFPDLIAKVTAYLMPTKSVPRTIFLPSDIARLRDWKVTDKSKLTFAAFQKHFLPNGGARPSDAELLTLAEAYGIELKPKQTPRTQRTFLEELSAMLFLPLPIAVAIRYKIYATNGKKRVRIFDHIIEAQRESFDEFQFRMLYWRARLEIAAALDTLTKQKETDPNSRTAKMGVKLQASAGRRAAERAASSSAASPGSIL